MKNHAINERNREVATLLAALRYWQARVDQKAGDPYEAIASDGGTLSPLDGSEIDALCERINLDGLDVDDAFEAVIHAEEVVTGCESVDELDEASDYDTAVADCPSTFTAEQRRLAQRLILRGYEAAIGRA